MTRILVWLNLPNLIAGAIFSGNAEQPGIVGWAATYFIQWTLVGYVVASLLYPKRRQPSV